MSSYVFVPTRILVLIFLLGLHDCNVAQNTLDSTAANQIVWKRECDRKVQAIEYMQYEREAAAFINTIDHQAITNLRHLAPFSLHSANARANHR